MENKTSADRDAHLCGYAQHMFAFFQAEFVSPEVIFKIVVDQYAGPDDDVRRYLTAMPTAAAEYFGPSLELCQWRRNPNLNEPLFAEPGSNGPVDPWFLCELR